MSKMKEHRERLSQLGFKQVNVWVREEDADVFTAQCAVARAQYLLDLISDVRVTRNGIEDERIDHLLNVEIKGVPTLDHIQKFMVEHEGNRHALTELGTIHDLLYDYKVKERDAHHAQKLYETAQITEKFSAGLEWALAKAQQSCLGRLIKARVALFRAKFEKGATSAETGDDPADEAEATSGVFTTPIRHSVRH